MGDGGVGGGGDSSIQGDFEGINADVGIPPPGGDTGEHMNISEFQSSMDTLDANPSPSPGPDPGPNGPDKPEAIPAPPTPAPAPPNPEKKEGIKRKARKRSLLNDEEKTVYRRSILGG